MYRPSFNSPPSSPQPNQGYSPLNNINLDMDMKNLFGTQNIMWDNVRAVYKIIIRVKIILWVTVLLVVRVKGSKKAKTSKTTSDSTHGGLNLNEESDGSGEEVRKVRPMGQDRAKKKASSSSRSESSCRRRIKNCVQEAARREAADLRREEVILQREMLELLRKKKRDKDFLFSNSRIDETLPRVTQEKLMGMK
ncbi:hypothetical protein Tco_1017388 [Tanacetum coccineum]|uniref:No apical meristem-associated C-terminal domain-containing protein n=1 Tax=Tanacetum coccineum TaxID=301880 RepID=A0ABQ5FRC2_9ASTR